MQWLKMIMPLLLTVAGMIGLGGWAGCRIIGFDTWWERLSGSGAILVYVGWMVWESRVSIAELDKGEVLHDKGTMELAAATKTTFLIVTLLAVRAVYLPFVVGGMALMLLGILIRVSAIRCLGRWYSHRLRIPILPLITEGPYKVVRHPAYLGTMLIHTGVMLVFPSIWSVMALLLLWYPAVLVRVIVEEGLLLKLPEYKEYSRQVRKRLIPLFW